VFGAVHGVGAKQRFGVLCGCGGGVKQTSKGLAWCYAGIRCKVKVLGAKVWCPMWVLCGC